MDNSNQNQRTVRQLMPARQVNMGGHLLDQPLPYPGVRNIDPFLLIHHWDAPLKGGSKQENVGVGPHPHRGFAPVTFIFKGSNRHQDSVGNDAIVNAGGTQWMHAGKGIFHSERPAKELAEKGGESELIQFWVNSPAKYKMEEPYYLPLSDEETPKIKKEGVELAVVAGEIDGVKGPAKTYSPQLLLRAEVKSSSNISIAIPKNFNALLYVLNGRVTTDRNIAGTKDMLWFNNDGEFLNIEVEEGTRFIVLSGEPIGEPIATYGPFVMNTEEEISQALSDAQSGNMGVLKEVF